MRKRLLSALLVLIMLVSIMPLAVSAEEECTEHSFVHCNSSQHECENCNTLEEHVDADGDCVCDICGGECHWLYNNHTLRYDATGHWYVCGHCEQSFGFSEHVDNLTYTWTYEASEDGFISYRSDSVDGSDGLCDYCGHCEHTNTAIVAGEGACIKYCVACGGIITGGCFDTDGDCACDQCGQEYHKPAYGYYSDESGHWQVCLNCGTSINYSTHVDETTTTYTYTVIDGSYYLSKDTQAGSDGVCEVCDNCPHTNTAIATGGSHCIEYCTNCGATSYMCVDEDGDCICDIGSHEYHEYITLYSDETGHWYACDTCGYIFGFDEHHDEYADVYSPAGLVHGEGHDGVCEYCGYGCTHPDYYRMENTYYGGYCRCEGYCTTCGDFIGFVGVDADGDGVCDVCGGIMWDSGTVTTNTSGTVSSSITVDTSALLTEDDAMLIIEGYDVEIVLSVDEVTSSVSSADSALILSAAGDNVTAVSYLDIDLTKMIYDTEGKVWDQEALTDLDTTVTVTVAIPQSLLDAVETATGTYSVVRVHDGVATVLATSYDSTAQTVTFATDRFSTYGIVFTGSTSTNNTNTGLDDVPQTGDGSLLLVGLALMMVAVPVVKKFVF